MNQAGPVKGAPSLAPEVLGAHREVPLLDGRKVRQAFLDNAASTKSFRAVSEFLRKVEPLYSNIHRGSGFDSAYCTRMYEEARDILLRFVGGDPSSHVVIPVRNTTEGLNLLANTLSLNPSDRVLTTILEHHSNDLPWRGKARVEYVPVDGGVRVSIGIHNDAEDVDRFLEGMRAIVERRWKGDYRQDPETGEYEPEGVAFDFRPLPAFDDPLD